MSDDRTLGVYNAQADDYVALMTAEAARDPHIVTFVAACLPGAQVLDLGCGPGHYAQLMARAGLQVDALDASPEMVARIPDMPNITPRVGRFDDITGTDIYHGIWANFSLLHAPRADLPRHLAALRAALRPGGIFHIGMKMGVGGKRDDLGRYYEYYSREDLYALLRTAGFTPTDHWTGQAKGLDDTYHGWIVIHADG